MESEKEAIKTKSTGYYEYKNNLYSKINKIFSLQSFNLFFICILIYYIKDNKNLFSNKQKEQKVNNIAEKSEDIYNVYPQIKIVIEKSDGTAIALYSKKFGKFSSYTKEAAERLALNKLETELEKNLINNLLYDKRSK